MRNLLIFGMVLAAATMAGWLKVQRDGERTTIEIDRGEIRSDAKQAIERGRDFLDRRDREYADQQTDQQTDEQLISGQPQAWQQDQGTSQQQPQQQQWGTPQNAGQQPNDGSAYQQVQFYNDASQPNQRTGTQASQPAPAAPYVQQQEYRR
jgi:hypothetical protein